MRSVLIAAVCLALTRAAAGAAGPPGRCEGGICAVDVPVGATWLQTAAALAHSRTAPDAAATTRPASGDDAPDPASDRPYVHWSERRGPAYPGDFWHSLGRYGKELPATLWDDTKATFTNPWSLAGFGAALASGIAVHSSGADDSVARNFLREGPCLPHCLDEIGDIGGNPGTHFAIAGGMFLTSLARDDADGYERSRSLINALAINGMTTMALKIALRTESPNGDENGWPSGHTSSSFTLATVLHEQYGPWVGVPCFAFASFVGYQRIDSSVHDLSDVVSGALIGIAIGHAVSENHRPRIFGMDVVPWVEPSNGTVGLALTKSW